jgi:large subunit ribosomal protein L19e
MKLEKKRALAARTLNVGKGRVVFNVNRLNEIKEAITKQDIRDLTTSGAIIIAEKKGRRTIVVKKSRRRSGSFKQKVVSGKRNYIIITRKLRAFLKNLKEKKLISREHYEKLRKEIRASNFKSLAHFKERISSMEKKDENTTKKKKRSKNRL